MDSTSSSSVQQQPMTTKQHQEAAAASSSSPSLSSAASIGGGGGGGAGGAGGTSAQHQSPRSMAGPNVVLQLGAVEVSKALQDGEKFVKWDEDSTSGTPVTMRVDPKGFYLCWVDQNNEIDLLDIATIRDVRTGQFAKKPRDSKLRQIVTLGSQDTLEEKTVTVCFGTDFVNVTFINFCATRKDIAQNWTDELMQLAYSSNQMNGSSTTFLQKSHTKLCLQVDKTGKIPVKNIIKLFASNKDDRRRVEKALDVSGLPSGKLDVLPVDKFQFEDFFNLYKNLTQRTELEHIFETLAGNSKRRLMSTSQLVDFLNKTQRDPRLNEILHPYANPARAKELIGQYEPNKFNAQKGQLSLDGFIRYLMSEDNPVMAPSKLDLCDDMEQPLSHYFINSSHNTYLTGHQLTGKSSVEIYRQSLLSGCRCVELDFWNGKMDEPLVLHGYTMVPSIIAKDVLEAIAESAFKTSDFPVILSFENHCNPRQQAKIANYCRDIFGDMLLDKPIETHPIEPNCELPPPSSLRRKIIIKNKKKTHHHHHHHHHHHKKNAASATAAAIAAASSQAAAAKSALAAAAQQQPPPTIMLQSTDDSSDASPPSQLLGNGSAGSGSSSSAPATAHAPPLQQIRQSSKESTGSSDTDSGSSDDESTTAAVPAPVATGGLVQPDKVAAAKETEAGAEISALVNYVQPVHFSSFENSEKKNRSYEMSSFDEKQATTLLKERPIEFVNYNKHQLSRVYPAGTRFDSSNFMPQLFWNAGCQLVALNYQTLDLAMQLNLGIFEYNQRCGYLLKPEFMRRKDRRLDPFAESTVDGIIAGTVKIQVISGQFLSDKKVGTYVEVDMFGLPADTVRKKFRTNCVRENGINPVYDEKEFEFSKVVLPELACIRLTAYEESGRFIGHRVLPVIGLCPGYRHVTLRTEMGQPITLATLFMKITVQDYIPHNLSDFAEALANPIKFQSEQEKRTVQLAVYTVEDFAAIDDDCANSFVIVSLGPSNAADADGAVPSSSSASSCVPSCGTMRSIRSLDVSGGGGGGLQCSSPKHRASICASTALSLDTSLDADADASYASASSSSAATTVASAAHHHPHAVQHQPSLDQQPQQQSSVAMQSTGVAQQQQPPTRIAIETQDLPDIVAESLEQMLETKAVREKRLEMEKKLDTLRKKHDKEKVKLAAAMRSMDGGEAVRKTKFYMNNKLVKRLSSKNMDSNVPIPACCVDLATGTTSTKPAAETTGSDPTDAAAAAPTPAAASPTPPASVSRSPSERLLAACRDFSTAYQECQEKYHEQIYGTVDKLLRTSQAAQLKVLKTQLEKETSDVMRQLNVARRTEVKALAVRHKDRDELVRMKREVASSLVERGVTERVRLSNMYDSKRDELLRQHELVRTALTEHRSKAKALIDKEAESRTCIYSDGFLVLFGTTSGGGGGGSTLTTSHSVGAAASAATAGSAASFHETNATDSA